MIASSQLVRRLERLRGPEWLRSTWESDLVPYTGNDRRRDYPSDCWPTTLRRVTDDGYEYELQVLVDYDVQPFSPRFEAPKFVIRGAWIETARGDFREIALYDEDVKFLERVMSGPDLREFLECNPWANRSRKWD